MEKSRIEKQSDFILEIDQLKEVFRRSYLLNQSRKENTAEHSWHVSMMALLFEEFFEENVDISRVVKMLLIHDIVEIDAGDTYIYDNKAQDVKSTNEQKAAKRIFGLLPEDQEQDLLQLWQEYEKGQTPEARYAYCMDRIIPLMHNYYTQGRSWQEHGIVAAQVYLLFQPMKSVSKYFYNFALNLIEKAIAAKYLSEEDNICA